MPYPSYINEFVNAYFKLTFDKMNLDGALFDLAKVENICKERLSRLNKEEFTKSYAFFVNSSLDYQD